MYTDVLLYEKMQKYMKRADMMNLKKKLACAFAAIMVMGAGAQLAGYDLPATQPISVSAVNYAEVTVPTVQMKSDYSCTDSVVRINWNKVSNATGYQVYLYNTSTKSWDRVKTIHSGTTLTYRQTGLSAGTAYRFRVRAYRTVNSKNYYGSTSSTFVTTTKPKQVTISSTSVTETAIRLNWTKATANGYRIYQKNGSSWKIVATIRDSATTTYKFSNLAQGTTYTYKIRAYRSDGKGKLNYGAYSTAKSITTKASTPIAAHGQLSVSGANIVDKNGNKFKIKGMSTHGIMWEDYGNILSSASLKVLRDDWNCNTIRIAMYTENYAGYTTGSSFAAQAKQKVETGVKNATDLGMYVIIDWHILSDGDPRTHQSDAVSFFTEMSKKYANYNNVIYEVCNEPNGGISWTGGIKSYCQTLVNTIRKYDSNAIIICGTGTWSQDIDQVLGNRLSDKNTVYALHFYANTHTDWLRNRLQSCYNSGLPVLVTEFGTCDASGNGGYNASQSTSWLTLLDKLNVGYVNWSASSKSETASAFVSGTNLSAIKSGTTQLTESGKFIRSWYRSH